MDLKRRPVFILQIIALWLTTAALAVVTSLSIITATTRSDCPSFLRSNDTVINNITIPTRACSHKEFISAFVYDNSAYFQSAHILAIQVIAASALLLFRPLLWAMTWDALEQSKPSKDGMTVGALQYGIELDTSPGLVAAALYARTSSSVSYQVLLVSLVATLSLVSPLLVSPIYKPHTGPHAINATITTGGGVGSDIPDNFDQDDAVHSGIAIGRALINAGTALNMQVFPMTSDISCAPFMHRRAVETIWKAQVPTVAARHSLDCSPSALRRLSSDPQSLVSLNTREYFVSESVYRTNPSFAGQRLGSISNDPVVTAVYLDASSTDAPGIVEGTTSIIFLAANGTLEGAQWRIPSPERASPIHFVDVLACTSTTRLEVSVCAIDQGKVTQCTPAKSLPRNAFTHPTDLDHWIHTPKSVAKALSASPVMAFHHLSNRLPMYDLGKSNTSFPPYPFLTNLLPETIRPYYNLSSSYITDVLFRQTAQGLVQGLLDLWPLRLRQTVHLISTFGASQPEMNAVILAISITCAMTATLAATLPASAREATAPDSARVIAISRNPQLDDLFGPYANRSVEIGDSVRKTRVGYRWVESISRQALVISPERETLIKEGEG